MDQTNTHTIYIYIYIYIYCSQLKQTNKQTNNKQAEQMSNSIATSLPIKALPTFRNVYRFHALPVLVTALPSGTPPPVHSRTIPTALSPLCHPLSVTLHNATMFYSAATPLGLPNSRCERNVTLRNVDNRLLVDKP